MHTTHEGQPPTEGYVQFHGSSHDDAEPERAKIAGPQQGAITASAIDPNDRDSKPRTDQSEEKWIRNAKGFNCQQTLPRRG